MSESSDQHYVIVGAGQAGAEVASELRKRGFEGQISLIGDEPVAPYRRPPLSKAYFSGDAEADSLLVLKPPQLEKNGIDLLSGVTVDAIDRATHTVTLSDGRSLQYDKLALTTGGRARPLPCPGNDLDGVFLLRSLADVDAIRAHCNAETRMAIVGGGFIGLEVAASARKAGMAVTVVETLDRVLARVTAPVVSAFFERIHREAGVDLRTGVRVEAIEGTTKVEGVRLGDGSVIPADVVVVGIGLIPNVELAEAAGLEVDNGIVVDACAQTSDPDIVAAGDCANHPNRFAGERIRLESVQNAMEQARVAAGTMLGAESPYDAVPWFWSDQYDCKLQMAGLSVGYDDIVLRGDPAAEKRFSAFYLRDGQLIAADSVGRPQDFMFAKKLVTLNIAPDRAKLADPEVPLKAFLPA
ncbi:FAD-dependent oxidoreductase [Algiphilus sp.]|uniref:NAD(P)/FAD-dependent oxidoreductase n=1 Tax=Algiphilus sp. TaxID=1872431 RepID=UPI0032EC085C